MDAGKHRRPTASRLLGALCGVVLSAIPVGAQSVSFLTYTPSVIPAGSTAPLLVEVEVNGTPSSVTVDFNPAGTVTSSVPLRNDGSGGDRIAGDRTYTAQLPVAPILAARTADDVQRVFIGFLNLFNGETRVSRGNLFVDVYTSDVGTYPVVRLSQFVQATSRLVNIHDPTFTLTNQATRVTQEFYRWFRDDYDVLNIVSEPLRFQNRSHAVIKNRVSGIGLSISDNAAAYGSAGRLVGISNFPIPTFYDGAETGFIHELGHQWINHLNVQPFAPGIPHWPLSSMAGGVMGFSIGGTGGQGGTFACTIVEDGRGVVLNARPGAPAYNDIDLYLMGLMPASQVRGQIVFADQAAAGQLTCSGQVFSGAVIRVGANDIVNAVGPRVPPYGEAPTRFRLATILVTRNGLASPEMMSLYSWMSERAEWRARVPTHSGFLKESGQPFFVATGGRGTLEMDLDLGQPDFALVPSTADATVAAGASASYSIAVSSRQRTFDATVTLSCGSLPANASCQFQSPDIVPGSSGQSTGLTISTRGSVGTTARGTYVVIVNGSSGSARHATAVTLTVQ
jgi:hypothetical protein